MTKTVVPQEQAESLIGDAIRKQYKDATDFRFNLIGSNLIDGNAYYISFASEELDESDSFYYAFVNENGCKLLDDGEDVIAFFQTLLDKRRTFFQRLSEFDFVDLVGALLAVLIVGTFVIQVGSDAQISKEYLALVSLVLGYYFGRNKLK